jgi:hypothetical protein
MIARWPTAADILDYHARSIEFIKVKKQSKNVFVRWPIITLALFLFVP